MRSSFAALWLSSFIALCVAASCAQGSDLAGGGGATDGSGGAPLGSGGASTASSSSSSAASSSSSSGGQGGFGGSSTSSSSSGGLGGSGGSGGDAGPDADGGSPTGFGPCVTQADIDGQSSGFGEVGFCNNPFACFFCSSDAVNPGDVVCAPACVCAPLPPLCDVDAGSDAADDAAPDAGTDAAVDDAAAPDAAAD